MNKKWMLIIAVIAGIAGSAIAGQDSCGGVRGKNFREKMAKELGLSADQKEKLKELHKTMRDVRKEHMEKMKALLDKSKEELLKPAPSKDTLYEYARASGELSRIMAEKEADHFLKVKAILTPEQFKKLLRKDFDHPIGGVAPGSHHGERPCEKGLYEKGPHEEMNE
jgi:Spy/CpxP family protein refolding chaperone